jgi:hypothetical protein
LLHMTRDQANGLIPNLIFLGYALSSCLINLVI